MPRRSFPGKFLSVALMVAGVIIMLVFIPLWLWMVLLGAGMVYLGYILFKSY
ncbi:MAG TPA: hypothetical protein GXZ32_06730 [Clostridiales bacterium]|nr:hypothetical protein [Clostridiales bacterium]